MPTGIAPQKLKGSCNPALSVPSFTAGGPRSLLAGAGLRGSEGIGRALIEASAEVARKRGAHQLEWVTAPDNKTARRLYDKTGAESEPMIEYALRL